MRTFPTTNVSASNATVPDVAERLVRVTHPFHPLKGRELVCVGERCNRYATRLLLRVDEGMVSSVPKQWTDLVVPDPEIVLGGERALFCVADLIELERLLTRLANR